MGSVADLGRDSGWESLRWENFGWTLSPPRSLDENMWGGVAARSRSFALQVDYGQFFIVCWGPVSSVCTSGFACLSGSSVFGELHRSLLSNLKWRRSCRGSLLVALSGTQ